MRQRCVWAEELADDRLAVRRWLRVGKKGTGLEGPLALSLAEFPLQRSNEHGPP
jgi:hypothetical protein